MYKLIKFCVVGGINTIISLFMFYLLNKILHIDYLFSSALSYMIGMLNSYILNKRWTFKDTDKRVMLQLLKFIVTNSISLCINLVIMHLLVDRYLVDSMISQIISTIFSTASNYLGSKLLVYRNTDNTETLA